MIKKACFFLVFIASLNIFAEESLEAKKESIEVEKENFEVEKEVKIVNEKLIDLKNLLNEKLNSVNDLYLETADDSEYLTLLAQIKEIRNKIHAIEDNFRKDAVIGSMKTEEGYAFWDQAESTISQLIMEYGSSDYLYVIPAELAQLKINLFSTIPIPRCSWDDMLKIILTHNGIGIKKLNPYLRQLYILKHDPCHVDAIVSNLQDLDFLEDGANICYVMSPNSEQIIAVQSFLERFSDLKQTSVHSIKTNVIIIGSKETIKRLVNLYDAVFKNNEGKVIKVVTLNKITAEEGEKILSAFFAQTQKGRPSFYQGIIDELTVVVQSNSLVLIGESTLVDRAEKVILDLEKQLDDPGEMSIFWYTCKHSDPNEIAEILERIYSSITNAKIEEKKTNLEQVSQPSKNSEMPIKPKFFEPKTTLPRKGKNVDSMSGNFVVDAKTGSILMVVKKEDLAKIKSLLKKLDIPKKMVKIDVLLVERKIQGRKQSGMNLLKIGSSKNTKETAIGFDANSGSPRKGLLDFIISRTKGALPSFDIALSFLMAQDEMSISDCPSILAINQTPATISIVDEISINNGAIPIDTSSGAKYEKSFSRAQFGTIIVMTPTIHLPDEDDENSKGFVTLQTDVSFDTTKSSDNDRPSVTRRHIENEVRVADGETIILGGLRRKIKEEGTEKIPFLGEIPGIGKLFGSTKKSKSTSEMFIFITPHIVTDPKIDLAEQKLNFMQKRQGDTDEFLEKLENAKKNEKKRLFAKSLKLFFER